MRSLRGVRLGMRISRGLDGASDEVDGGRLRVWPDDTTRCVKNPCDRPVRNEGRDAVLRAAAFLLVSSILRNGPAVLPLSRLLLVLWSVRSLPVVILRRSI